MRLLPLIGHRLSIAAYLLFALFPLYWIIKIAVTPDRLLFSQGVTLLPGGFTLSHFAKVLTDSDFHVFINSLIVSFSTAALTTLIAAAAGYAFSRFQFRGKMVMAALLLFTQMFPLVMIIAPIYRVMAPMGLTNSLLGLILIYSAFNVRSPPS